MAESKSHEVIETINYMFEFQLHTKKPQPLRQIVRNEFSKIIFYIHFFFIFIYVFSFDAKAQENFLFERLQIDEGLSNNSINCILQTKDGFLWIATKDGLNRFDGHEFKIFIS